MLLCIDFTGEKAKITSVENKREELRAVEALELDVSDLGEYLRSKSGKIKEIIRWHLIGLVLLGICGIPGSGQVGGGSFQVNQEIARLECSHLALLEGYDKRKRFSPPTQ
jgi:hypothetical protein